MNMTKTNLYLAGGILASWMSAGIAFGDKPAPSEMVGQSITTTAQVEKVDMKKRDLTLKGADGDSFTIQVPEDVTRLDAVKPGDRLSVNYTQAVAVSLKKPGEAAPMSESAFAGRAPGEMPGGMMGKQITASAQITKIDKATNELTIKTPDGDKMKIDVKDSANQARLEKLKPGDSIQVTYTSAVAVAVMPKK